LEEQTKANFTTSKRSQINGSSAVTGLRDCLSYIRSHLQLLRIPGTVHHTPQICQLRAPSEVVVWLPYRRREELIPITVSQSRTLWRCSW